MSEAIAKKKDTTLIGILNDGDMKEQWRLVLPKCLTADRLARVAITQIRKTPKLALCSRESFLGAMMKCAEMGVEPNGRDAHLIPYGKECTLIIDYKGIVRLVRNDVSVKDVQVFTVRAGDEFEWSCDGVRHTFKMGTDRGEVIGVYTKISWADGSHSFGEPMTRKEAEAIKSRSKSGRSGPWVTDFVEMWKKSAIRRDSKMWPLTPETFDAITSDDDQFRRDASRNRSPIEVEVVPFISADQVDELNTLIESTSTDIARMLEWVGAESVEDIPSSMFDKTIAKINEHANVDAVLEAE